jgi:hypothetical protein
MKVANASDSKILKLTYSQGERQLDIQLLQLKFQREMLKLTTSALGVASGLLMQMTALLMEIYQEIALGFASFQKRFGMISDSEYDDKIRSFSLNAVKAAGLDILGEKLYKRSKDSLTTSLTNLPKLLTDYFKEVDAIVDGGMSANMDKNLKTIANTASKSSKVLGAKKEKEVFNTLIPTRHFGGMLEKFHYGGIIKQGNEALLMTPNPTAVLSPSDTRQAVRGSNEKHIHIHFNAPVYGIPKFEEMVNRIVMKAATGIR